MSRGIECLPPGRTGANGEVGFFVHAPHRFAKKIDVLTDVLPDRRGRFIHARPFRVYHRCQLTTPSLQLPQLPNLIHTDGIFLWTDQLGKSGQQLGPPAFDGTESSDRMCELAYLEWGHECALNTGRHQIPGDGQFLFPAGEHDNDIRIDMFQFVDDPSHSVVTDIANGKGLSGRTYNDFDGFGSDIDPDKT